MKVRMLTAGLSAMTVVIALISSSPAIQAAPKKPGLYGPTNVTVGQEATYTSVFNAALKSGVSCFVPNFSFSDETPNAQVSLWFCLNDFNGKKSKAKLERNVVTHVFTQPGIHTVTVRAGGVSFGTGASNPKKVKVKGPKTYTLTVNVNPAE